MSAGKGRPWLSLRGVVRDHLAAIQADQQGAPLLLRRLLALPSEEQLRAVAADPAFLSPSVARGLLGQADRVGEESPGEAARLTALAVEIAHRLPPEMGAFARDSLLGEALCREAEAWRIRGDLAQAELDLALAFKFLDPLPLDSPERAEFCCRFARLRRDQEREDEALALMAWAAERFDALPDLRRAAECQLELGWMLLDALESDLALELFETVRDGGQIHPSDPACWLSLRHGLGLALADLLRGAEAWSLMAELAGEASTWSRKDRLRAQRVEAAIARRLRAPEEAIQILSETWPALLEEEEPYEALATLAELAEILAEEGRELELEHLKSHLQAFAALPKPVRQALMFTLEVIVLPGAGDTWLFEKLHSYLRRARHDPEAHFAALLPVGAV